MTLLLLYGALQFPVTGNAQCNKHFTNGMLALHSFMYDHARTEFVAASQADRKCAMARWGEAMTYTHPLWGEEDLPASRKALDAIGAAAMSDKERAYVDAARALFSDGDPNSRRHAWLQGAERMHAQFPSDDEVALQHALALIANSDHLRDQGKLMRAAAIGLDVLARRPQHPGAAHYVIHACDTPDHAILALPAAERYAKIAPAASHALHMPSHIFVQLGMWERVARSNELAWAASQKDSSGQAIDHYDWHTYAWLGSAYLELGQIERARALLRDLAARMAKEDKADPRFAYALIARLYVNYTEAKEGLDDVLAPVLAPLPLEAGEAKDSLGCALHAPGGTGGTRYPFGLMSLEWAHRARAEAAQSRGDEAGVRAELKALAPIHAAMEPWRAVLGPKYYERRDLFESSLIAGAQAFKTKSPAALARAADALEKLAAAGDPFANGPAFETPAEARLGELQLAAGKPKEALAAFDAALTKHPRLSRALLGAARAAHAAHLDEIERQRYAELTALWKQADPGLLDVEEARSAAVATSQKPLR